MKQITVTLSANAGVSLDIDGHRIWVDALHDRKVDGFSTLTPRLQREMMAHKAFSHPQYICYTHDHPDHYSAELTAVAKQLWTNAKVLMPGDSDVDASLELRFLKLPHEGEQYADAAHYGLLISVDGCNILIPGDCEVASPALTAAVGNAPIHVVLLNFPWVTLRKGREYTMTHFKDAHILLYHLPFEEDDLGGYRRAAREAAAAMGQTMDIRLLCDPLQTEIINV